MNHRSHLGVYARILNEEGDKMLLIRKARGPYTGLLDMPGGSMEDGELLEETLVREIKEETGCNTQSHSQLATLSILYPYIRNGENTLFRHIGVLYTATVTGALREDGDGEDSEACFWYPIADLTEENSAPFVRQCLTL